MGVVTPEALNKISVVRLRASRDGRKLRHTGPKKKTRYLVTGLVKKVYLLHGNLVVE